MISMARSLSWGNCCHAHDHVKGY